MRLSTGVFLVWICIVSLMAASIQAQGEAMVVPTGQRQLFLDDYIIAEINDLTRTMHQPAKKGAVIRPDGHKEIRAFQIRSAPSWVPEAQVFKLVVTDTAGPVSISTVWESTDGLHWSEKKQTSMPMYSLVYDSSDPDPARRYKAFLPPEGVAVSPDGVTWTMLDMPIPSQDEHNLSFDKKDHLFIGTVKRSGPYGRSHAIVTSRDFEHWTDHGVIFHADELDQELGRKHIEGYMNGPTLYREAGKDLDWRWHNVDMYNVGVFRYEGLFIAMPAMFHRFGPVVNQEQRPQYAFTFFPLLCSRDLDKWEHVGNRQPFIGPSPVGPGAYDLAKNQPPSSPVIRGDELWFYYNGLKYSGWNPKPKYQDPDRSAVCLAVLRRDGFVSLDAAAAGSIITKPIRIPAETQRLLVNLDAPQGELRAAILNTSGQPVEGFAINQCVPVIGDQPRAAVTWEGKPNLSVLAGQDIQIRFRLKNASFYSFWFE